MNDRREYIREWRTNNKEKVKKYNKTYYERKKMGEVGIEGDKCPNCHVLFNPGYKLGKFIVHKCPHCGYTKSENA